MPEQQEGQEEDSVISSKDAMTLAAFINVFVRSIARNGWPTTLLILVFMCAWHAWSIFEPQIGELVKTHITTVKTLTDDTLKKTEILDAMRQDGIKKGEVLDGIQQKQVEHGKTLDEVKSMLLKKPGST